MGCLGSRGLTAEESKRTFRGDANVLYQLFGEVYKTIYICKCIYSKSLNRTLKISEILLYASVPTFKKIGR